MPINSPAYSITNDVDCADFNVIEEILRTSYWAAARTRDVIEATFKSPASLSFFALDNKGATVGFGRVVTDRLTIGWVCDVMTHPDHRGNGIGKLLMQSIIAHPELNRSGVRLILATKDAHGLYEQFSFHRRELMWRHPGGAPIDPNVWSVDTAPSNPS